MKRLLLPTLITLALGACAVGPDYQRPAMDLPQSLAADARPDARVDLNWWTAFNDPVLDAFEQRASIYNRDLLAAIARVDEAAAQLTSTRADLLPQLNGAAGGQRGQPSSLLPSSGLQPGQKVIGEQYNASLQASYELDLWGKLRRATEASRAELLSSQAARDTVALTVAASVANGYFQLRTYDEQLDIARRTLKSREDALVLRKKRFEGGLISELDYRQAEAETATARAAVPLYEQLVSQAETALKVLIGASPREIYQGEVSRGKALSTLNVPPTPPSGLPSDLLLRRPDVVAAEQQLVAANARIGVARAAYFPDITLTAALGSASLALGDLFTGPAALWSFAGDLTMPIFNWGKTGAGVDIANARQKQALASYEQSVQNAFRDTRDALVAQQKTAEQLVAQNTQVSAYTRTTHLARLRYDNGYSSYIDVLDSERSLFSAELDRANTRLARLQAAISVFRALGGGYGQLQDAGKPAG